MIVESHHVSALRRQQSIAVLFVALVTASACSRGAGSARDTANATSTSPEQPAVSHLSVAGDSLRFVQHDDNLPVGFPASGKPLLIKNPYESDKAAISTGGAANELLKVPTADAAMTAMVARRA